MANIFTLENLEDFSEKLNIDDLYEKQHNYDISKLALFNKILNRIHVRIKTTSRQKIDENFCWYVVPEIIIGVPRYDQGACIAYLLDKLTDNGFIAKYIHPNTLFISWQHWVPGYVRTEIKRKTGVVLDEYGNKIGEEDIPNVGKSNSNSNLNLNVPVNSNNKDLAKNIAAKKYTPINAYKPLGNF